MLFSLDTFRGIFPKMSDFLVGMHGARRARDVSLRSGTLSPNSMHMTVSSFADKTMTGFVAVRDPNDGQTPRFFQRTLPVWQTESRGITICSDGAIAPDYYYRGKNYRLGVPPPTIEGLAEGELVRNMVTVTNGSAKDLINVVFAVSVAVKVEKGVIEHESLLGDSNRFENVTADATFAFAAYDDLERDIMTILRPHVEAANGDKNDTLEWELRFYNSVLGGTFNFVTAFDPVNGLPPPNWNLGTGLTGETAPIFSGSGMPPEGCGKIIKMPNDFWVTHVGYRVHFSEIGQPYLWPDEYVQDLSHEVIGIERFNDDCYIFQRHETPLIINATGPEPLARRNVFPELNFPCVSGASVTRTRDGVIYASAEGMVIMNGVRSQLITQDILDRDSFDEFNPSSIRCVDTQDNTYVAYGNDNSFTLDFQTPSGLDVTTMSWDASDAKVLNGRTYILNGGLVQEVGGLTAPPSEFVWESGLISLYTPQNFHSLLVRANFRRTSTRVTGGMVGEVGGTAIGDAGCPPHEETSEVTHPVVVECLDRQDRPLFEPRKITDEKPYPINFSAKEHDVFRLRVTARVPVYRVSLASET